MTSLHRSPWVWFGRRGSGHSSFVHALDNKVNENGVAAEDFVNAEVLRSLREAVDREGGKSEGVDDATLLRFLRGKSFNFDETAKAIVSHQQWRASFVPNGYINESEIAGELGAKKTYMQGQDKQSHPIIFTLGCKHFPNKKDFEEFKRFSVYIFDKAIAAAPDDGKFVGIVDLNGLSFQNLDTRGFIAAFDILQSHYPDRIEKFYLINAPHIFNGLWKVVSPFINGATREKILIVDKKKTMETLLDQIDIQELPVEYGGTRSLTLLQDAVVPGWPPVAH